MSTSRTRRRRALAGILAVAALGAATPAQAAPSQDSPSDCDVRIERLQEQANAMADRRGWYEMFEWWDKRWDAVYTSCLSKELSP